MLCIVMSRQTPLYPIFLLDIATTIDGDISHHFWVCRCPHHTILRRSAPWQRMAHEATGESKGWLLQGG